MIHPGPASQKYATILPDLKQLGYHADMKPGHASDDYMFRITVSRHDTAYVTRHGTWWRDDGLEGENPQELLHRYRYERLRELRRNIDRDDMKGIAFDILQLDTDIPVAAVLDVHGIRDTGVWTVEYRGVTGGVNETPIDKPLERIRLLDARLTREWRIH